MGMRRLFTVTGGASLTISGLNIAYGSAEDGGCIHAHNGSIVLNNGSVLSHCLATGRGGGVFLAGYATMIVDTATITV